MSIKKFFAWIVVVTFWIVIGTFAGAIFWSMSELLLALLCLGVMFGFAALAAWAWDVINYE